MCWLRQREPDDHDEADRKQTSRVAGNKARGGYEFTQSMVTTGCATIEGPLKKVKEDLVFPPREVETTRAEHLGAALMSNFEEFVFGKELATFVIEQASRLEGLSFITVGDAAGSNIKLSEQFMSYLKKLGQAQGLVITSTFSVCVLHQLARILSLHLERQALNAAMYSVSRLHQHSRTRDKTRDTMKALLKARFKYYPNSFPPFLKVTSGVFRRRLYALLTGSWDGESDINTDPSEATSSRGKVLEECFRFFNGDLLSGEWAHYCYHDCCHENEAQAFQHVFQRKI